MMTTTTTGTTTVTTTEAPVLDADRAARLARLRERRASAEPTAIDVAEPADTVPVPPVVAASVTASAGPRARRRSPARNAKIITAGASATAVLGMIAGYGFTDALTSAAGPSDPPSGTPVGTPGDEVTEPVPPASATVTPLAPSLAAAAPQVIVVVVDGATGRTLSTTSGTGDVPIDLATERSAPVPAASAEPAPPQEPAAATPPAPVPVAVPAAVELAVPAPPAPTAPAAAPAPAVAPQPQAVSDGS